MYTAIISYQVSYPIFSRWASDSIVASGGLTRPIMCSVTSEWCMLLLSFADQPEYGRSGRGIGRWRYGECHTWHSLGDVTLRVLTSPTRLQYPSSTLAYQCRLVNVTIRFHRMLMLQKASIISCLKKTFGWWKPQYLLYNCTSFSVTKSNKLNKCDQS